MKPKYKVHLCPRCIEQLEQEWVYAMPREQVEIVLVAPEKCDNYDLDGYEAKLKARNPEWG